MNDDDERGIEIFENIGIYLGHTLAYYHEMYGMEDLLLLGRVMSGKGGNLIYDNANMVLRDEYPKVSKALTIHLPDEKNRRVGQSVAAASIPDSNSSKK